jgi:steroid 5-alpha reductase family enzyme
MGKTVRFASLRKEIVMSDNSSGMQVSDKGSRSWGTAIVTLGVSLALSILVNLALSKGTATIDGIPVIALCSALAFIIQWIAFIPAYLFKTERFYDLTGSLTYLSLILLAVFLGSGQSPSARAILIAAMVVLWSGRLGWFLFRRIGKDGKDRRFDGVRSNAPRFFIGWTLQGLWVVLTLAAALVAITTSNPAALGIFDAIGAIVWAVGFGIEATADRQKRQFRRDPKNKGQFIQTGLWSWSRHPNYFGEIVLWLGIAIMASSTFEGWQWVGWISPVFVAVLLTQISGVPLLEKDADKRWAGQKDYEAYKARTPVLIPRPPRA